MMDSGEKWKEKGGIKNGSGKVKPSAKFGKNAKIYFFDSE